MNDLERARVRRRLAGQAGTVNDPERAIRDVVEAAGLVWEGFRGYENTYATDSGEIHPDGPLPPWIDLTAEQQSVFAIACLRDAMGVNKGMRAVLSS